MRTAMVICAQILAYPPHVALAINCSVTTDGEIVALCKLHHGSDMTSRIISEDMVPL